MKALTHAEREVLGRRARKQISRSGHADFAVGKCPAEPLAILADSMRGRVARLVPVKYERMAASPFVFFRGAVPIMAADLGCHPNTELFTQLCGDAHIENLGAYEAMDGRVVFDINDFDETIRGPFEWDVKRLATSVILAGREAGISRGARADAVRTFTGRYRRSMRRFANMPVLELARFQIHRLARVAPMPAIFAQAERSTPGRILEKLTEPVKPGGIAKRGSARRAANDAKQRDDAKQSEELKAGGVARKFRAVPPLLSPVRGEEARKVLAALDQYAKRLQPERQHFLAQYTPVDVAFKVVGTGSVGLRDFVVYMEGHARPAHIDPLFLQIKEEPASAYTRFVPQDKEWPNQGERVMNGQRAMQLTSDPFLGYTTIENRDYVVRQLNDHKAALDLKTLSGDDLLGYSDLCGELLARGHARAGDPVCCAAYMGGSDRFDEAVLHFAHVYADKTERDWEALRRWLKKRSATIGA